MERDPVQEYVESLDRDYHESFKQTPICPQTLVNLLLDIGFVEMKFDDPNDQHPLYQHTATGLIVSVPRADIRPIHLVAIGVQLDNFGIMGRSQFEQRCGVG